VIVGGLSIQVNYHIVRSLSLLEHTLIGFPFIVVYSELLVLNELVDLTLDTTSRFLLVIRCTFLGLLALTVAALVLVLSHFRVFIV
jgi:hypothetical protein